MRVAWRLVVVFVVATRDVKCWWARHAADAAAATAATVAAAAAAAVATAAAAAATAAAAAGMLLVWGSLTGHRGLLQGSISPQLRLPLVISL